MRLYHRTNYILFRSIGFLLLSFSLYSCSSPKITQELLSVTIAADRKVIQVKVPAGSTVQQALESSQIAIGELDRVQPSLSAELSEGSEIIVTRIREELYTRQVIIPFTYQELMNEALPEGEKRLSQAGVNGLQEETYRRILENEIEVSNEIVQTTIITEAIPEVVMVGSQSLTNAVYLPGKLAYLSAGNAWIIENTSANRKLVVSTSDLDGRIFSLSKNGKFLLFTRRSKDEYSINKLWMASLEHDPIKIIDLEVDNIVHFAEFSQDSSWVAFSTAEWREAPPGWQANNDLYMLNVNNDSALAAPSMLLPTNSGGIYGWWGNGYSWSPDQSNIIFMRPDGIGIIGTTSGTQTQLLSINPYQTGADWAWVPAAAWSPDGTVIYTVDHNPPDSEGTQSSQFNLIAFPPFDGTAVTLKESVGMFAYPIPSPINVNAENIHPAPGEVQSQDMYSVAYLQADAPEESATSKYSLYLMDPDGLNSHRIFPPENTPGLDPQHVVWSPVVMGDSRNYSIALIYNGNIWIIDSGTGVAQQLTVDGLADRIDWR